MTYPPGIESIVCRVNAFHVYKHIKTPVEVFSIFSLRPVSWFYFELRKLQYPVCSSHPPHARLQISENPPSFHTNVTNLYLNHLFQSDNGNYQETYSKKPVDCSLKQKWMGKFIRTMLSWN